MKSWKGSGPRFAADHIGVRLAADRRRKQRHAKYEQAAARHRQEFQELVDEVLRDAPQGTYAEVHLYDKNTEHCAADKQMKMKTWTWTCLYLRLHSA
jgi:hypothetical protein